MAFRPTSTKGETCRRKSPPTPRWKIVIVAAFTLVLGVPIGVIASDVFSDVPDSNTFHDAITWLADNDVTLGCNPPANTEFCPTDNVTRQQMAGFMRRLANTFGNTGAQVLGFDDDIAISGTALVEVLSIEVAAKSGGQCVTGRPRDLGEVGPYRGTLRGDHRSGRLLRSGCGLRLVAEPGRNCNFRSRHDLPPDSTRSQGPPPMCSAFVKPCLIA